MYRIEYVRCLSNYPLLSSLHPRSERKTWDVYLPMYIFIDTPNLGLKVALFVQERELSLFTGSTEEAKASTKRA